MTEQNSLSKLATALAKAQTEMRDAVMNKTNPHFRSKYADLSAVRDATLAALNNNGLAILQSTHQDIGPDGQYLFYLRTTLLHTSGESLASDYPLPRNLDKPQAMGSALTYARRYSWAAICGIASDEDDDGNEAQNTGAGRKVGKQESRDITYGVGTGAPAPPSLEVYDQVGDVIEMATSPKEFLKKITDLVETSGAYWPNNKDGVEWVGRYAKGQNDKPLEAQARSTFKFGRDAFANYQSAQKEKGAA